MNAYEIVKEIIGEIPGHMEWVYGISAILLVSLIVGCLIKIFIMPLELFKR